MIIKKIPTQLDGYDSPNLTSNGQFFKPNFHCADDEIPTTRPMVEMPLT